MLSEEELEMTIILKKHGDGPDSEATHSFLIQSWSQSKGLSDNCTGAVSLISTKDNEVDGQRARKYRREHLYSKSVDIGQAATECTSASRLYTQLSKIGVDYGELFQGLEQCHASVNGAVAQIVKTDTSNEMPHHYETDYILHPALMEQLVSLYWPVIAAAGETNTVHLPASIGRVTVSARALSCPQKPGSALHAVCRSEAMVPNNGPNRYDMFAVDAAGEPIITIQGLSTSPIVEHGSDAETTGPQELCYKLEWEPVPEEEGVNEQALHGFDAEIVIIHGKTKLQYKLVAALTEHLEATLGTRINSGTLEDIAPIAQDKLCLVLTELASPLLATLDAAQFEALKMLLTTVQGALWVVQGAYHSPSNPETNMISGFSRTLRSEGTLANFVTLYLDPQDSSDPHHTVQTITRVLHMTLGAAAKVEEKEFCAQGRKLFTPRILDDSDLNAFVHEQVHPAPTKPARFRDTDRPLRASLGTPGAVETLVFHDDENLRQDLPDSCVDIAVKAVGISHTDLANGARLGMECSGTVTAVGSMVLNLRVGDRVAAIVTTGCLSNVARVQSQFVFKAPAHMSFEALATMPVAYCTAVYALMKEARLAEGESILIHDAASAVGQAALTLASRIGASVWVTVKTAEEKETIMQHYSIPQDRIWFSGATYFSERIQSVTKGAGVDVVFNTLTDYHILRATWASIAQFGQFFNVVGGQQTTLHVPSATSVTVYSIDFAALAAHRPSLVHRTLSDVARMVQYGQLRPLLNIASYDAAGTVAALQNISALQSNERSVIVFSKEDYITVGHLSPPSPHHQLIPPKGPAYRKALDAPPQRRHLHPHRRHRRPRPQHSRLDGL
jgi:NADPH:quinone reductase-like Zn-dependent oxidoreductase